MTETEACIVLNMIPGMGPVRLRRLLPVFGSPQGILSAKAAELDSVEGIGAELARAISNWKSIVDLDRELSEIDRFGAHVTCHASADYPRSLREIYDFPIVLYIWGNLQPQDRHAIAVVGTRKPSHYASDCAKRLSYQVAHAGLTVVSGLARGIDTLAHQAALAAHGRTIAVLGSGMRHIYPEENRPLAEKIAENGAVVTEFSMSIKADRQTFPMRNRIVSGLCFGLLVVEAGQNSGALITANQAAEQGRSIYAVPGRIDNPGAIGSNRLIQHGARLVSSAADILDDLGMLFPHPPELARPKAPKLEDGDRAIYEAIGDDETPIDTIISKTGLPTAMVSSTLLALEMRRLVKQLPGQRFVKTT